MADDGYTTILRTTDPTQGELFAEMLRREGIEARFHQVRSTLIGMAGNLIEMTVDVPTEAEARAREVLADLEYVGAAEALEQQALERPAGDAPSAKQEAGADERADAAGPLRSRRHPLFAAGFALFLPGGGHLYGRRPWTALVLALGLVGCLAVVMITRDGLVIELAVPVLFAIVATDALDGVVAARAETRGQHSVRGRQLARGFVLLGIAVVLGIGARLVTAAPQLARTAELARYKVSCSGTTITIENGTDGARALDISNFRVGAFSEFGEELYKVGPFKPLRLSLAPGERGTLTPEIADWLARSCKFVAPAPTERADIFTRALDEALQGPAPRPLYCGYVFSFVARDTATDKQLEASGRCIPPTPTNPNTGGGLDLAR
ncbi:MAG TPA: hypothetical protein VIQ54_08250 [Polyangia bacterium]|jgi:hypothetical protein